jgi:hypothetical protein
LSESGIFQQLLLLFRGLNSIDLEAEFRNFSRAAAISKGQPTPGGRWGQATAEGLLDLSSPTINTRPMNASSPPLNRYPESMSGVDVP